VTPLIQPPEIVLRWPVKLEGLRDGINSLVVVLLDGRKGRQIAKQAFFAAAPLTEPPGKKIHLPAGLASITGKPIASNSLALGIPHKARQAAVRSHARNLARANVAIQALRKKQPAPR
jgi:hypothetical protein